MPTAAVVDPFVEGISLQNVEVPDNSDEALEPQRIEDALWSVFAIYVNCFFEGK